MYNFIPETIRIHLIITSFSLYIYIYKSVFAQEKFIINFTIYMFFYIDNTAALSPSDYCNIKKLPVLKYSNTNPKRLHSSSSFALEEDDEYDENDDYMYEDDDNHYDESDEVAGDRILRRMFNVSLDSNKKSKKQFERRRRL